MTRWNTAVERNEPAMERRGRPGGHRMEPGELNNLFVVVTTRSGMCGDLSAPRQLPPCALNLNFFTCPDVIKSSEKTEPEQRFRNVCGMRTDRYHSFLPIGSRRCNRYVRNEGASVSLVSGDGPRCCQSISEFPEFPTEFPSPGVLNAGRCLT